jgi:hypothetical protein
MNAGGLYLYCFARGGLSGQVVEAFPSDPLSDADSGGLATLERGGVAAVFTTVSLGDFVGEAAEANLKDPDWIVPRACHHERVIEAVMRASPVLPVRFGAVFSSQGALVELLAARHDEIARFLEAVADKEEWAVRVLADPEQGVAWVLASDPKLACPRRRIPQSPGARYLAEKKLRGDAEKQFKSWCRALASQVADQLAPGAVDTCPVKTRLGQHHGIKAETVLNRAFLLMRRDVDDFQRRVEQIQVALGGRGLTFVVSGPWPPYHFCPAIEGAAP